jgi:membrane protein
MGRGIGAVFNAVIDRLTGDDPRGSVFFTWLYAARGALLGEAPVLAGGTALFAILATIPTLAGVVAVYGLIADAHSIQGHMAGLERVLPRAVVDFIITQMERQAQTSTGTLSFTLISSTVVAVYSARSAASALIEAINQAYRVRDDRRTLPKIALTLGIAAATLFGVVLTLILLVVLPILIAVVPGLRDIGPLASMVRWPVLFAVLLSSLAALFRVAPAPRKLVRRRIWPGAFASTVLWLIASFFLSLWVENVADYNAVYGTFASVIVVILWFYLSVLSVLIGGFLNAELERAAGAPTPTLF